MIHPVDHVKIFVYLGSRVAEDGGKEKDIDNRLTRANQAFATLYNIWKSKKLRKKKNIQE